MKFQLMCAFVKNKFVNHEVLNFDGFIAFEM